MLLTLYSYLSIDAATSVYNSFNIVIPAYSMIRIMTTPAPVSMTMTTSLAGASISSVSNSNMYLQITSIVNPNKLRRITAKISNSNIPVGTILKLASAPCSYPATQGNFGAVISPAITLIKNVDLTIIDGIGSCYTSNGTTDGYNLTFSWQPNGAQYNQLVGTGGPTNLTIMFTMADMP